MERSIEHEKLDDYTLDSIFLFVSWDGGDKGNRNENERNKRQRWVAEEVTFKSWKERLFKN